MGDATVDAAIQVVAELALMVGEAASASVLVPDGDDVVVRGNAGGGLPGTRMPRSGPSLAGACLDAGVILVVEDLRADASPHQASAVAPEGRSAVALPVHVDGEVLAALVVARAGTGRPTPRVLEGLEGLAAISSAVLAGELALGELVTYRAIFDQLDEAVCVLDADGVRYANPAAEAVLAVLPVDLDATGPRPIATTATVLDVEDHALGPDELAVVRTIAHGATVEGQLLQVVPDHGPRQWLAMSSRPLPIVAGTKRRVLMSVSDVTEVESVRQQLRHQADHDALTGLPNRVLLVHRTAEALAAGAGEVGLLYCDLDRFKVVNEGFGHETGDQMLRAVGDRFAAVLGPGELLARAGGDEFAVLVVAPDATAAATTVAERLLAAVATPVRMNDRGIATGVSIGVAIARAGGERTPDRLLADADFAMYRAKGHGGGWALFDDGLRHEAQARHDLESDLLRAVEAGELRLCYQPVVALATGRLVGFEALVRWERPGRGLVQPELFLPAAVDTGAIVAIGSWVLAEASAEAGRWRASSSALAEVRVAVNLSARQLATDDLVNDVARAVTSSDRGLELELTETELLVLAGRSPAVLGALRRAGARIGIDDFGTGYASLAHLIDLPVDFLKIDRSFVSGLGTPSDMTPAWGEVAVPVTGGAQLDRAHPMASGGGDGEVTEVTARGRSRTAVVTAVVGLAADLGLDVVAEGIERPDQAEHLLAMGCTVGQGFLYGHPMTPDELAALLARAATGAPVVGDGSAPVPGEGTDDDGLGPPRGG
ncbi:MAG: EAL domain-containing protein [Acidimicrobiales bacterium]